MNNYYFFFYTLSKYLDHAMEENSVDGNFVE